MNAAGYAPQSALNVARLGDLDLIFDRVRKLHNTMESINVRIYGLSDRLQGPQAMSSEGSAAEPNPMGLVGEFDSLLRRFERTAESSSEALSNLERL